MSMRYQRELGGEANAGAQADAYAAALAVLQGSSPAPLAAVAPRLRAIERCPHCHEGFGSASLPIHVRRCRALLPDPEAEALAAAAAVDAEAAKRRKKKQRRQVPSLVDLCLRFLTRNFQGICMDKVMVAPEHEAALVDALPTELVHRIIVSLVYENRKLAEKEDKHRANARTLQRELDDIRQQKGQLEGFRHQAATFRARCHELEQSLDGLRRQLEMTTQALTSAKQQHATTKAEVCGHQKSQLRLESRLNVLQAENDRLKGEVRDARKKEMEAFKRLASISKSGRVTSSPNDHQRKDGAPTLHMKRPATHEIRRIALRPRNDGSKIPLPPSLPATYLMM